MLRSEPWVHGRAPWYCDRGAADRTAGLVRLDREPEVLERGDAEKRGGASFAEDDGRHPDPTFDLEERCTDLADDRAPVGEPEALLRVGRDADLAQERSGGDRVVGAGVDDQYLLETTAAIRGIADP